MKATGWNVTLAGLGLNLALGVLYSWSIFSRMLTEPVESGGFGWSQTLATLPYTVAIAFNTLIMVPAGRLQDRRGPRVVATVGAVLCGTGLIVAGLGRADAVWPTLLGFGMLVGTGIGLGYAAATPAAIKWFGPERKGLITGIVVAGFGLAPLYIAPLSKYLLATRGIPGSFLVLGILVLVFAGIAAQFLVNPRTGPADAAAVMTFEAVPERSRPAPDRSWREMVRSSRFWSLYVQYICSAAAGLMIIGHLAKIVSVQSGGAVRSGFLFVALLALFNAGGRVAAGRASDAIGRVEVLIVVLIAQAVVLFFFGRLSTVPGFLLGTALVGLNYGACISLFPAASADYWGTKNLGLNYGLLFTAWGVGGLLGPNLAGLVADSTGSYAPAFRAAAGLLLLAAVLAVGSLVRLSRERRRAAESPID